MPISSIAGSVHPARSGRHFIWNVLAVALACALVLLLVRAADWDAVAGQIRHAKVSPLLFAWLVLGGLSCLARALRWYILLSSDRPLFFWPVFWANASGNFANSVLPARAGEFIRATMVSLKSGLSTRYVLAVAVCERVFDLLVLIALTRLGLSYVSSLPLPLQRALSVVFWGALCTVAVLILTSQGQRLAGLRMLRGWNRFLQTSRIGSHLQPFIDGIRAVHNGNRIALFVALTVPIWLLDAWGAKLVATSLGLYLPLPVALILLAGLACGSLLPTTPGQLGVFQFVAVRILAVANIEYNQALTYSLVLQAGAYLLFGIWGIPGLWMYRKERAANRKSGPDGDSVCLANKADHVVGV